MGQAAVKIQAFYRCYSARKEYLVVMRAVRVLQEHRGGTSHDVQRKEDLLAAKECSRCLTSSNTRLGSQERHGKDSNQLPHSFRAIFGGY